MIHDSGVRLLAAAVISKAHEDYITGPDCNLAGLEKFVRSDLFQVYSLGINPDPDTVLSIWAKERSDYRCQVYMSTSPTGAQKN